MQDIRVEEKSVVATTEQQNAKTLNNASPQQQYRMVALDLDGTLLNSEHKMTSETVDYMRYLDSRGFQVAIATGRGASTVWEQVIRLNLPKPLPLVCSNGSRGLLVRPNDQGTVSVEEIFSLPVPQDVTTQTIALAQKLGCFTQYYHGDEIYANPTKEEYHHELANRYITLTGSRTVFVDDNFESLIKAGKLPSKLLVLCKESELDHALDTYHKAFVSTKRATLVNGMGWFLEILHPEVCKGNGLKRMCENLGNPIDECIAFGDGHNDLEFLQFAGKGIAMKNGQDVVKKAADEITELTNNEDGVRKTLQRLERQGSLSFSN